MPEEQRRILEMLAAKQITIEEADRLLEASSSARPNGQSRTRAYRLEQPGKRVYTQMREGAVSTDGGAYLRQMRALGLRDLRPHDLIALKATGVNSDYVQELRASGLTHLRAHDLIALKSTGVVGAYVAELREAGLSDLEAHDIIALRANGVDGAYVRRMRSGFGDLAAHDLIALRANGIDADEDVEEEGAEEEGAEEERDEQMDDDGTHEMNASQPSTGDTINLLSANGESGAGQ